MEFVSGPEIFLPREAGSSSISDVTCRVFRHNHRDIHTDVRYHYCTAKYRTSLQTRLDLDTAFLRTLNCCHGSGRK